MHRKLQISEMGLLIGAYEALPGPTNFRASTKRQRLVYGARTFAPQMPVPGIVAEVASLSDASAKQQAIAQHLWGDDQGKICGVGEPRLLQMATGSQAIHKSLRRIVDATISIETGLLMTGRVVCQGILEEVFKMGLCFVALRTLGYNRALDVFCACCTAEMLDRKGGLHTFLRSCAANTTGDNQMVTGDLVAAATAYTFSPHLRNREILNSKKQFAGAAALVPLTSTELMYLQQPSVLAGFEAVQPTAAALAQALQNYHAEALSLVATVNLHREEANLHREAAARESATLEALRKEGGTIGALRKELHEQVDTNGALRTELHELQQQLAKHEDARKRKRGERKKKEGQGQQTITDLVPCFHQATASDFKHGQANSLAPGAMRVDDRTYVLTERDLGIYGRAMDTLL